MNIQPCCEGCGTSFAEAKALHPSESNPENWCCQQCATEQAQVHLFDAEARRTVHSNRESLTNGEYAERGAIALCDYSGACNPEDHDLVDLIADLGHYSDREGHNFRAVLRRAIRYWEEER